MKTPIYLDNAATTPMDPRVLEKMLPYLTEQFGNPSSQHFYGRQAVNAVNIARHQVAELINADAQTIVWTSGATEAINLAIKGAVYANCNKGKHIVTCLTEHSAGLDTCRFLESTGFVVTYLAPEKNGLLDLEKLAKALRDDTILVSVMHVNNEIGVIQDIKAISEITRARGILFHSDAAQSAGKIPIDLKQASVDLMSFSAHKVYGPKGIGALYVGPEAQLQPLLHGGGHEHGLRSGTLPTHQIVGMGEAFAIAKQQLETDSSRIKKLRDHLWQALQSMGDIYRNGDVNQCVAGILNVTFDGLCNAVLLPALRDLALSTGSACHAAMPKPSPVLTAIGLTEEMANNSVRLSLGRFTTAEEIDFAIEKITQAVKLLRA